MRRVFSKILLLIAAISIGIFLAADTARSAAPYDKTVLLTAGKADTVELLGPVADVLVANPAVADVGTLRSNRLYIVGRAVGETNVLAYDDEGNQIADITVRVRLDDKDLQSTIREFFPDEKVSAKTVKDNIILTGTVSSPAISSQVRDLASRFVSTAGSGTSQTIVDLMTVKGEQQVMIKVRVVEAKRTILRELGLLTSYGPSGGSDFTLDSTDIGNAFIPAPFGTASLLIPQRGAFGPLSATLRALETNGLLNTLAEPNLTAISGETAGFLAGGEYPVPSGRDSLGQITITFKQFGVALNFTPTVMNKDRIALHLSTEVSEIDDSVSVGDVPGLSVRRAETTVEMGSGGTIMIAGLIKSSTLDSLGAFPGLQNLPVLGELFKSKSFSRNESELLVIVTPYLVDSYAEPEAVVEAKTPAPIAKDLTRANSGIHLADPKDIKASAAQPAVKPVAQVAAAQPAPKPVEPKVVIQQPKAPVPIAATAAPKLERTAGGTPLNKILMHNLKRSYGNRVPDNFGNGGGFGYIVD